MCVDTLNLKHNAARGQPTPAEGGRSVTAQISSATKMHENKLQLIRYCMGMSVCVGELLPFWVEMGKFLVQSEHVQEPLDWGWEGPTVKAQRAG